MHPPTWAALPTGLSQVNMAAHQEQQSTSATDPALALLPASDGTCCLGDSSLWETTRPSLAQLPAPDFSAALTLALDFNQEACLESPDWSHQPLPEGNSPREHSSTSWLQAGPM